MVEAIIDNTLYDKFPNLVLGFHGCNSTTFRNVLYEHQHLRPSENDYDWLGNGIYFWENGYERALDWALARYGEDARIVGAIIDLGHCLNLTDTRFTKILSVNYYILSNLYEKQGEPLPENRKGRSDTDLLLRNLDCAVIQRVHRTIEQMGDNPYDSVRGVFSEGKSAFPGSAISEKTHIQICIVNPNCIKGYFAPIPPDNDYPIP